MKLFLLLAVILVLPFLFTFCSPFLISLTLSVHYFLSPFAFSLTLPSFQSFLFSSLLHTVYCFLPSSLTSLILSFIPYFFHFLHASIYPSLPTGTKASTSRAMQCMRWGAAMLEIPVYGSVPLWGVGQLRMGGPVWKALPAPYRFSLPSPYTHGTSHLWSGLSIRWVPAPLLIWVYLASHFSPCLLLLGVTRFLQSIVTFFFFFLFLMSLNKAAYPSCLVHCL